MVLYSIRSQEDIVDVCFRQTKSKPAVSPIEAVDNASGPQRHLGLTVLTAVHDEAIPHAYGRSRHDVLQGPTR